MILTYFEEPTQDIARMAWEQQNRFVVGLARMFDEFTDFPRRVLNESIAREALERLLAVGLSPPEKGGRI